jgi:deoxyribonuclease-4
MMRLGVHVPVAAGLVKAARRARSLRCECLQIFARNARGWRGRTYAQTEIAEFRGILTKADISPLVVHSCYLQHLLHHRYTVMQEMALRHCAEHSLTDCQPTLKQETP